MSGRQKHPSQRQYPPELRSEPSAWSARRRRRAESISGS